MVEKIHPLLRTGMNTPSSIIFYSLSQCDPMHRFWDTLSGVEGSQVTSGRPARSPGIVVNRANTLPRGARCPRATSDGCQARPEPSFLHRPLMRGLAPLEVLEGVGGSVTNSASHTYRSSSNVLPSTVTPYFVLLGLLRVKAGLTV